MQRRILIVDDDPDLREIVQFKLGRAGFDTHTEPDGVLGLQAARALTPDLVIADWMMPRMTGLELCTRLREAEETRDTPVIILTAKALVADVHQGFSFGAEEYLTKPFSPAELLTRVQHVLSRVPPARRVLDP